ncbi:hypothetical protein VP01_441g8 [Puccinia sorghi]|uniref:Uncharacterized protein n=1 Tax=Puccinia sorghi TaxID=27349 RepID=A0A0L6URJ5_9BASI|nr:hypothetical protein VP01_441g8 [Puccinia sorghi]
MKGVNACLHPFWRCWPAPTPRWLHDALSIAGRFAVCRRRVYSGPSTYDSFRTSCRSSTPQSNHSSSEGSVATMRQQEPSTAMSRRTNQKSNFITDKTATRHAHKTAHPSFEIIRHKSLGTRMHELWIRFQGEFGLSMLETVRQHVQVDPK